MILSSQSIRARLQLSAEEGGIILRPYAEESQQPASYDLRASEPSVIRRNMMTLLASKEWVELPVDIAATLRICTARNFHQWRVCGSRLSRSSHLMSV
jgi:dCTP deaminase